MAALRVVLAVLVLAVGLALAASAVVPGPAAVAAARPPSGTSSRQQPARELVTPAPAPAPAPPVGSGREAAPRRPRLAQDVVTRPRPRGRSPHAVVTEPALPGIARPVITRVTPAAPRSRPSPHRPEPARGRPGTRRRPPRSRPGGAQPRLPRPASPGPGTSRTGISSPGTSSHGNGTVGRANSGRCRLARCRPRPRAGEAGPPSRRPSRRAAVHRYTVRPGDNLTSIARHLYGRRGSWMTLYQANQATIANPNLIYPRQVLRVPPVTGTLATTTARYTPVTTSRLSASPGTTLGCAGLEALWERAGGSPAAATTAAAVAMAESGGQQFATGAAGERGYWQINPVNGALSTYDPYGNARAAVTLSADGANWAPWTTYITGAYHGRC